jgi:hypothetical protein
MAAPVAAAAAPVVAAAVPVAAKAAVVLILSSAVVTVPPAVSARRAFFQGVSGRGEATEMTAQDDHPHLAVEQ